MKKHLKVLAKPTPDGAAMEILIIDQSHRCSQFGTKGYEFLSSNNMRLQSSSYIEYQNTRNHARQTLAVLGDNRSRDKGTTKIPIIYWEDFKIAIEEYNSYEFREI